MKRRKFTAAFKRRVVLEALRGEETVRSIASRHGVHPNRASKWKAEAHEGLLEVLADGKGKSADRETDRLVERLHARIGELTVERDFFRGAWSAWAGREGEADPRGRDPVAVAQMRTGGGEPFFAALRAEAGGRAPAGASVAGGQAVHGVPALRHAPREPASAPGRPRRGPGPGASPDGGGELAHGASGAAHLEAAVRSPDPSLSPWRA